MVPHGCPFGDRRLLTFTAMGEETESSVEEAARGLQTEQWKELEQMREKQMLTLELEEALEEEPDQVYEIRLEKEHLLEEDSLVRELQIALDFVESQQQWEVGAEAEAEVEAEIGSRAARSAEQKAVAAQGSSPAVGAGVFSSSLEDEENRAGVAMRSLQKMEAQLEGAPTTALRQRKEQIRTNRKGERSEASILCCSTLLSHMCLDREATAEQVTPCSSQRPLGSSQRWCHVYDPTLKPTTLRASW
ncbi:uncharacterized protein [Saccopteryx bilineata]|uniref:uncharacterized protein n=1 Tax=Saccopteryx bilineata TaxID=59482 RepID=UPI00338FACDB